MTSDLTHFYAPHTFQNSPNNCMLQPSFPHFPDKGIEAPDDSTFSSVDSWTCTRHVGVEVDGDPGDGKKLILGVCQREWKYMRTLETKVCLGPTISIFQSLYCPRAPANFARLPGSHRAKGHRERTESNKNKRCFRQRGFFKNV